MQGRLGSGKKTLSELENKYADVVLFQEHILLIKSMESYRLVGGPAQSAPHSAGRPRGGRGPAEGPADGRPRARAEP